MIQPFEDWRGRIVTTDLQIFDVTNPVSITAYLLGNVHTNGAHNPVAPRACKLVGYGVSTIVTADTVPGNWTVQVSNLNAGTNATFSVGATTTLTRQTAATVPWSTTLIFQAGDHWLAFASGPNKNSFFSFLTLEWEII